MRSWASTSHSHSPLMISGLIYCTIGNAPLFSCPNGVTGIKLHYIRLLAGPELVLSSRAPAKNPTEHPAHIHHYADFLHPIFWACLRLLIHSFLLNYCRPFLPFPSIIVSFWFLPFLIFLATHSPLPPFSFLWESDASYFPPAFWDQAERQVESAVLSKSLVVLIECIILLMFCHFRCTLERNAVLEHP